MFSIAREMRIFGASLGRSGAAKSRNIDNHLDTPLAGRSEFAAVDPSCPLLSAVPGNGV